MTMIIDHGGDHSASLSWRWASAAWSRINPFSSHAREVRRFRREHEMLLAMSNHELHDIGLTRGAVVFGVSSGRGVCRDADR